MRIAGLLILLSACASSDRSTMEGSALVEVNTYAQRQTMRWVVVNVSVGGERDVQGTFEVAPGAQQLEVEWRKYDATENESVGAYLLPIADRPKVVDDGTRTFSFTPESGRLYRLQWTPKDDGMELTLVDAGRRPVETG